MYLTAKITNIRFSQSDGFLVYRADALYLGALLTTLGRQLWDMCLELGFIALLIPIHLR